MANDSEFLLSYFGQFDMGVSVRLEPISEVSDFPSDMYEVGGTDCDCNSDIATPRSLGVDYINLLVQSQDTDHS